MKNIFLLLLISICSINCSDDDNDQFKVAIDQGMFTFKPVEGGAVLKYKLTDPRVNQVKVEYVDEFGVSVYKVAGYAVDTLLLNGFNSLHEDVPVKVSFLDKNGKESEGLDFTFNTLSSTLYSFFDQVKVNSYWSGFQLAYDLKGRVEGSATVYFVGTNPTTKLRDTLMLENFRLEEGPRVKAYSVDESQQQEDYTVMITTEDDRQRIAKKQVWTGVKGVDRVVIPNQNFDLYDPFHKIKEVPHIPTSSYNPGSFSKKYLFDGDTKGTQSMTYFRPGYATPPFTFLAGADAINKTNNEAYFVLDIKEAAIVGEIRLYARIQDTGARNQDFNNDYYTKLPCNVKVYAWTGEGDYNLTTNPGTKADWKLKGSFEQDPNIALINRWYVDARGQKLQVKSSAELAAVAPIYMSIPLSFEESECRFFKIEINATYRDLVLPTYYHNDSNNVTFHELEVYGKK